MSRDYKNQFGVKRPQDVFKKCPACGCVELIPCDGDMICLECDWNSIEVWVEAKIDARAVRAQEVLEETPNFKNVCSLNVA